ncbi:MAG: IS200/IS605 family transposase [Chloracidobacterium sp.]|nr:IS200/IS605 family transposase [Chloracidobacterium sp.]
MRSNICRDSVYSEINYHITWHTKTSLPMITERIEDRLYHYLTHKILETPGAILHAIGGIQTHIHIGVSLEPNILVSDWIGKLKGSSSYYINHEVQPKALEWQRGYGIVTFGTKDLQFVVDYINNQKEHHKGAPFTNGWRNTLR